MVRRNTEEKIQINFQPAELEKLEQYNFVEFIEAKGTPLEEKVVFCPYVNRETHHVAIEGKHIPPHKLAFRQDPLIQTIDDGIVKSDEFLVVPESG